MKTLKVINLTVNETKALKGLINSMYAEYNFSDVDINDLKEVTEIPTKKLRGIIASLVKKGLVEKYDNGEWVLFYLTDLVTGYVKEWSEDAPEPVKLACNGFILF